MTKKTKKKKIYTQLNFFVKLFYFLYLKTKDLIHIMKYGHQFNEYGLTLYTGKQGAGKTTALVEYLERMRRRFPNAIIVTNFGYKYETMPMNDWRDFFEVRNGTDGVIFAIDEIQNEYNSNDWKTFPEGLLSEITQQRKQRVKIVATSQVFTRVVKQLREQCYEVVECRTLGGRWTFTRCFDAEDYDMVLLNPTFKHKVKRKWRKNFVQDSKFREMYDSYAKVEKMKKTEYIPRHERGIS